MSDYLNEDEYASLKWDHIEPPIDSSNLSPVHWSKMCSTMELCYKTASFGAVLLIHGTDTLAFTAAILDVLQLSNPYSIVITGSQRSIFTEGSDCPHNFRAALDTCLHLSKLRKRGVFVVFGGEQKLKIINGDCVVKHDANGDDAFDTFKDQEKKSAIDSTKAWKDWIHNQVTDPERPEEIKDWKRHHYEFLGVLSIISENQWFEDDNYVKAINWQLSDNQRQSCFVGQNELVYYDTDCF